VVEAYFPQANRNKIEAFAVIVAADFTLLVAAGEVSSLADLAASCQTAIRVIAVDAGIKHLRAVDFTPTIIVGDLDSATKSDLNWAQQNGTEIIHISSQSESDLAKALTLCHQRAWTNILVNGIEGGRIDHHLGGFAALFEANPSLSIIAELPNSTIRRITAGQHNEMQIQGTFSVFSFGTANVTLQGSEWDLSEENITFSTKGLSNRAAGKLRLELHSGDPVFILTNKTKNDWLK
jgi:thiamine pyrophosphokinase